MNGYYGRGCAFLPAAFDGRTIVSSTTFKEINASDEMLKKYTPYNEVKSLVWGRGQENL